MFCSKCGNQIADNSVYCNFCSYPVSGGGAASGGGAEKTQTIIIEKERRGVSASGLLSAFLLVGLLAAVAVGGLIGYKYYLKQKENESVFSLDVKKDGSIDGKVKIPAVSSVPVPRSNPSTTSPKMSRSAAGNRFSCSVIGGAVVNLRQNCDTIDCDTYSETKAAKIENGAAVELIDGFGVPSSYGYTWEKISVNGNYYFIASSKLACERGE